MAQIQQRRHLGYSTEIELQKPYARFLTPELGPLSPQAGEACLRGPRAPELFEPPYSGHLLQREGYSPVEHGFALTPSGGMIVSVLTDMPDVTPAMWAWWFSWHGNESSRYKLWHPQAHVSCTWADGKGYTGSYIGRTSNVTEYIGAKLTKIGIHFVRPSDVGFDETALEARGEVAICARGYQQRGLRVQVGTFCHYLRRTDRGCEMRSRFWLGGDNVRMGDAKSSDIFTRTAASLMAMQESDAVGLLVHCAEEMAHLAKFLPQLYAEFRNSRE